MHNHGSQPQAAHCGLLIRWWRHFPGCPWCLSLWPSPANACPILLFPGINQYIHTTASLAHWADVFTQDTYIKHVPGPGYLGGVHGSIINTDVTTQSIYKTHWSIQLSTQASNRLHRNMDRQIEQMHGSMSAKSENKSCPTHVFNTYNTW